MEIMRMGDIYIAPKTLFQCPQVAQGFPHWGHMAFTGNIHLPSKFQEIIL